MKIGRTWIDIRSGRPKSDRTGLDRSLGDCFLFLVGGGRGRKWEGFLREAAGAIVDVSGLGRWGVRLSLFLADSLKEICRKVEGFAVKRLGLFLTGFCKGIWGELEKLVVVWSTSKVQEPGEDTSGCGLSARL